MNSLNLLNFSACAPKHFETPCLMFCKAFTLSLIKIEPVSIKPKPSCAELVPLLCCIYFSVKIVLIKN